MKEVTCGEAQRLTSPNPFALLTSRKPDGTTNVMAVSWWTYVSNRPFTIAACLSKKGFSGECIKSSGGFGLSMPSAPLAKCAQLSGTCSGRGIDKALQLGIPLVDFEGCRQSMVEGSRLCISCKLVNTVDIGDHTLYIGEVEHALGDSDVPCLFAFDGYAHLSPL